MSMQKIRRWGHDFLRISGGIFKPLGTMGKSQMSKGEPIKTVNYLSCLIHPIICYCEKLVDLVIAWDGKGMAAQIRIGEAISFWQCVSTPWASKNPKNVCHSTMLSCFRVLLTIAPSRELYQEFRTSCVWNHSCFWLLPHFAQAEKLFLVIISGWVSFPTFCCIFLHCFQAGNHFSGNA